MTKPLQGLILRLHFLKRTDTGGLKTRFMRIWLSILVAFLFFENLSAQCPVSDFSLPTNACIRENILIQNTVESAVSYSWDFCSGDFQVNPQATAVLTNSALTQAWSIRTVKDQNNWYGFAISVTLNKLLRFNYGTSLYNTPVFTDLGNPSNLINGATDFQLMQEGSNWYALVVNTNSNTLLRLDFGISLASTPTAVNLGNLNGLFDSPSGITVVQDAGSTTAFIASNGASQIVRVSFGSSVLNTPSTALMPVPGGAGLRGLVITKECNRWYGLVLSYGNSKVFSLDFSLGLQQPFVSSELTFYTGYAFPATIAINYEGGEYYAFIQSALGNVYRLSFGNSIVDGTGTGSDLGTLGVSNSGFAQTWTHEGTTWYGFSIDRENGRLIRLSLPVTCNASQPIITTQTPPLIYYTTSGVNQVTLQATDINGNVSALRKSITVSSVQSRDITFTSQNICANHDVLFDAQNTSGGIASYSWSFGDGNISVQDDPVHQFGAAGEYRVVLEITGTNSCKNVMVDTLSIYDAPIANFVVPLASPLCTNQELLFDNSSVVDPGFPVGWQWTLNGSPIATSEDFLYTFTNTSAQQIKLKVSIPGCESEITKNVTTLVTGPRPDFTITGQCEDTNVTFTNATTGTATTYGWNFGDGQSSSATNPVNVYANPGPYTIVLTASNAVGCNNTISKPLTIYSKPQVDFTALAPPFSCSGTPTQFNDLTPPPTDSNLTSWAWNFGDAGDPQNTSLQKNPAHTYATAANYTVTLTVGTNFLCSSTFQKQVTISQTPTADFTYSALCEDSEVAFADASPGTNQAWNWQIGSAFYFTENPTHAFTNPGNFDVSLSVTGMNNCIGSTSRPVIIRPKLALNFSVTKNCREQLTEFTNITNDAADPIVSVVWDFDGQGSATTSPATFSFLTTGDVSVGLTVDVQSGCTYSITKPVTISEGPLAAFTATPNTGEAPLDVEFFNTSLHANTYVWSFDDPDHKTSTQPSPSFIYSAGGSYSVQLVATDLINCSDTTTQLIEVLEPAVLNLPYPNPGTGTFTVEWRTNENVPAILSLVDATGREVRSMDVISEAGLNRLTLDITGQPSGLYILRITYSNTVKSYRLVVIQ